jgi:hypothetical protein
MKLTDILKEIEYNEPLYHATYKALLPGIKTKGLDTRKAQLAWEDSKPGYIYLAKDPEVAASYAETSEVVPDDWLDEIIILTIDSNKLDPEKLFIDLNVQDNEGDTLEYRGIIPFNFITNIEEY